MRRKRFQEIAHLYHAAMELPESQRARFLETCKDDDIRQEALSLLQNEDKAKSFLEDPALEVASRLKSRKHTSLLGMKLGNTYRVISELGKGGMGEVYQAKDEKLGRDVAIKVLPEEFAMDADRVARFEREAKLLASLNHPNIASIYGLEESEETHFLILELVEGETLADLIKKGPIPVEESLKFALQIAEALEAAHEKGVIHRDLKPANIKVTPNGKVKVLDFGLAKAFAGDSEHINLSNSPTLKDAATQKGMILGTPAYMSPEQARGETVDKKADIWAFGCVLFEMLTGRTAFEGRSVSDVIASVLKIEPEWKSLPLNLHPRIRLLLERCLEKDPKDRYGVISDARVDIQKVLADPIGVLVQPVSTGPPRTKPRLVVSWIEAALAVGIILAAVAVWKLKPSALRPVARFQLELSEGPAPTRERALDVSRDGTCIVYTTTGGLYLRRLKEIGSIPIKGAEGRLSNPTFSPDGLTLAYLDRDIDQLFRIPLNGGAATLIPVLEDDSWDLDWTADETIVFVDPTGIRRVSAKGGTSDLILEAKTGEVIDNPQILPGGEAVLFTSIQGDAARILVASLETRERKELGLTGIAARYVSTGHLVYVRNSDLWAVPFDLDKLTITGGGPKLMEQGVENNNVQASFSISETGTLVYVAGGSIDTIISTLVMVDREGVAKPLTEEFRAYRGPRFSPQGDRVAVEVFDPEGDGSRHIYVLSVDTGIGIPLTINGAENISPVWTSDGQTIIFASDQGQTGNLDLYGKSADGTGQAKVVLDSENNLFPMDMLPGDVLLYREQESGGSHLRTLVLGEEDSASDSVATVAIGSQARVSPDGRWIAFVSIRSAQPCIWVLPYPPANDNPRSVVDVPSLAPVWSQERDEIFFLSIRQLSIVSASVQTSPSFGRDVQETLFSTGQFYLNFYRELSPYHLTLTPDGERFVFVQPVDQLSSGEPAKPRIHVILNWFEELKEQVPVK